MSTKAQTDTSKNAARLTAIFMAVFIAHWLFYIMAPGFHAGVLQGEDRLVEWGTVIGFMGAGIVLIAWVVRNRRAIHPLAIAYFAGIGLFALICAGEEISWGQRILGFETPAAVSAINEQGEFNIHNLESEHFHPKDIVSWFMKLFGIILPILLAIPIVARGVPLARYVAPLYVMPCFVMAEIVNASDKAVAKALSVPDADLIMRYTEELVELLWAWSLFFAVLGIVRRWMEKAKEEPGPAAPATAL